MKKYSIYLFKNRKPRKLLFSSDVKSDVIKEFDDILSTNESVPYEIKFQGKRNSGPIYELALVFPVSSHSNPFILINDLGQSEVINFPDKKFKINKLKPFKMEEKIYDYKNKKRISFDETLSIIRKIKTVSLFFSLNKNIFIQTDDTIRFFGNKNISDCDRLFNILKEILINDGRDNFLFTKDINTQQRKRLYTQIEELGYKRSELFRHYSY